MLGLGLGLGLGRHYDESPSLTSAGCRYGGTPISLSRLWEVCHPCSPGLLSNPDPDPNPNSLSPNPNLSLYYPNSLPADRG